MKKLTILLCFFTLVGCQKDIDIAKDSLEGSWNIVKAYANDQTQTGNLGTITFYKNRSCNYSINAQAISDQQVSTWALKHEKVNSGFVKVDQFTLQINTLGSFNADFEDQTTNAHKNAKKVALQHLNQAYELFLEKQ